MTSRYFHHSISKQMLKSLFCKTRRAIQLISSLTSTQFFTCWYLLLTNGPKNISFYKLIRIQISNCSEVSCFNIKSVRIYANISSPENKLISGTVPCLDEVFSCLPFLFIGPFSTTGEKYGTTCSAEEQV